MAREGTDLRAVYDAMAYGVVVGSANGSIVFANAAARRIVGAAPDALTGPGIRRLREDGTVMTDDELPTNVALRGEPVRGAVMGIVPSDGIVRWLLVDAVPVHDSGGVREVVTSFVDITERRIAEAARMHAALRDRVTELPTRAALLERAAAITADADRTTSPAAMLVLEFDCLVEGEARRDPALREAAQRIRAIVRHSDTIARLEGPRFAVLLTDTDEGGAREVARKLIAEAARPSVGGEAAFNARAAIGIALYPRDGADAGALLAQAGEAIAAAWRSRSRMALASPRELLAGDLGLAADLRRALERGEVGLHYQPIVRARDATVMRFEALLRWRRAGRSIAAVHLPRLASQSGVRRELLEVVLRTSLRDTAEWRTSGVPLQVAVNLSVDDLADPELVAVVERAIRTADVAPEVLAAEVSAASLVADPSRVMSVLDTLASRGVHVAIDDLTAEPSVLAQLENVAAHGVKIDRSLVQRLTRDRDSETVVALLVEFAHSLGIAAVAEGVEDEETRNALKDMRIDALQGYFVARPMVAAAVVPWLATAHRSVSSV